MAKRTNGEGSVSKRKDGMMMLNSGVRINVVSQILGHKDPAMTLRRYATSSPTPSRPPRTR